MAASPAPSPRSRGPAGTPWSEWIARFGIYFLGVAIGLLIVGMIWQARAKAVQAQQGPIPVPTQSGESGRP